MCFTEQLKNDDPSSYDGDDGDYGDGGDDYGDGDDGDDTHSLERYLSL